MRRLARPWLVLLLCLATLFNGVAAAAVAPVAAPPCDMSAGHDDGGNSPCGDCGDSNALCVQQCAAMFAGVLVAKPAFAFSLGTPSERVSVGAAALFDSHAGPPGFQPPR